MTVVPLYGASDRVELLRERLTKMRDDLVDRMVRRGNPEPAHLPLVEGIETTLRLLDGEKIAAANNRPPEPAPSGSVMATADPDGEHVRIDLEMSGGRASLRLDPLLALRLGGEVLEAVGLVMRLPGCAKCGAAALRTCVMGLNGFVGTGRHSCGL